MFFSYLLSRPFAEFELDNLKVCGEEEGGEGAVDLLAAVVEGEEALHVGHEDVAR